MGTRWQGLLAPVNEPTDDQRRFLDFTCRTLPLSLKWQRVDAMGHDDSVVVGSLETVNFGTLAQAIDAGWITPEAGAAATIDPDAVGVWGSGELFDDADPAILPRLAQDVGEAKLLLQKGVIAPSVDPIPVGSVFLVEPGSDTPISPERYDELFMQMMETGVEPPLETLFEMGLIGAATLVTMPAFSEVRPFELITTTAQTPATAPAEAQLAALTAAAPLLIPVSVFDRPDMSTLHPIRVEDRPGEPFLRVTGCVAPAGVCHTGFRGVCYTAPSSASDYVPFHRYLADTDDPDQPVMAVGRLTAGYGKVGTGCTHLACRGKDDHACNEASFADAIRHYDQLDTLAHVRAYEADDGSVWVAGYAPRTLTAAQRAALGAQRVSGDWRDVGGNLELVEVLALTPTSQEGFPIPRAAMQGGRQVSLTAAGWLHPDPKWVPRKGGKVTVPARWVRDIADRVLAGLHERARVLTAAAAPTDTGEPDSPEETTEHTGAMLALRMTDDAAAALAVDGGEPADELHMTLAYLGQAADIPPEVRQAVLDAVTAYAAQTPPMADCMAFSVQVINPADDDMDTAVAVGIDGDGLPDLHTGLLDAVSAVMTLPEQHTPWLAHVTLIYSDDPGLVDTLADRTNQDVPFDRIRIAFGGEVTDIPLTGEMQMPMDDAATASALFAEMDAAITAELDVQVQQLLAQLNTVEVV